MLFSFCLECNTKNRCNIHIFKTFRTFKNFSSYNQSSCVFCCNIFKDDIITLPCKHIFDLRCFITYTKLHYLEKKNKQIKCPICKVENDIYGIFKKYKVILELRLLMMKKRNIIKNIYVYNDIYENEKTLKPKTNESI